MTHTNVLRGLGLTAAAVALAACGASYADESGPSGSVYPSSVYGSSSAAPSSEQSSKAPSYDETLVLDCADNLVTEPLLISWTCQEAGTTVTNVEWTSWDLDGAEGTGDFLDDGEPVPATVELSDPDDDGVFTTITVITEDDEITADLRTP